MAIHRAGSLKQVNKTHKHGKHKSNRQIDSENKGRVPVKITTRNSNRVMRKEQRKQQLNDLRKNKREEALNKKRNIGGAAAPPFLTTVIALNECIDPNSALAIIEACDGEAHIDKTNKNVFRLRSPRMKHKYTFVTSQYGAGNEISTLDYLKVCDSTLFLLSATSAEIVDPWGEKILNMALSQGIPTPMFALMDLESIAPKKRSEVKAGIQKVITKVLPLEKLMLLDKTSDGLNMLRRIGNQKRNDVHNKQNRAHLYSEVNEFCPGSDGNTGTLKVTGYLRGIPLSVNQLVHIPGLGDYQMSRIDSAADPFGANSNAERILAVADSGAQESLQRENVPDEMDAEQTFPTDAEIAESKEENKKMKLVKKIPKGMSDYQACWIPDIEEVEEESDEESDEEDSKSFMSCESDTAEKDGADQEMEENASDGDEDFEEVSTEQESVNKDQKYDEKMDLYEERQALAKIQAAKNDAMFPDEIDTPSDVPARVRFQKYRGLESFRTSPWDVKENLPFDYAKIFQFKDFNRIKKRIVKNAREADGDVEPGMYVTLHIANVPTVAWNGFKSAQSNLVVYGMLPHEQKMSVMNVLLKRTQNSSIPIKSKERLVFQVGYRRFIVNPVFSQHTNGDKHKYERFFKPNTTVVATFYAPIQFPPAPVLCFRENPNTTLTMVAQGSLLACTPDRVVLKRVVLSGHPFKIHRKVATIRFMFHNKDDINYFKPCKLRTKCGRIGHIKESLGTHGHMKCVFDGQLKSFDTVFLYLYKRVFPKWNYQDCIVSSVKGRDTASSSVADINMD